MATPALGMGKQEHHELVELTLATRSSVSSHSPLKKMLFWWELGKAGFLKNEMFL